MKHISKQIEHLLSEVLEKNPLIKEITEQISKQKGKAILVGGAVRDLLLNIFVKDLDIEVYGLQPNQLENILKLFGPVSLVGKSFGVFRLHGIDADWSLPRADSSGRKPTVEINPFMPFEESFKRRDLTINSMGIDLVSKELIDPYNGQHDLQLGILHATDKDFFIQDPLRFFRVMQFIGRFEMQPDAELNNICSKMSLDKISNERIENEFEKLFLKSKKPSLGIKWLDSISRLKEILPEIYKLKDVPQNPIWHPEGDVFEHTMQAIDAATNFEYKNNNEKLTIIIAALCHDLGKITATKLIDCKYISYGHEYESEKFAKPLLARITSKIDLKNAVLKLIKYHMQPGQLISNNAKAPAYKRLALKLAPITNLYMLSKLFMADRLGRNGEKGEPLKGPDLIVEKFINIVKNLNLLYEPQISLLTGADLMEFVKPGPELGEILKKAYEIQINKNIDNKEDLKSIVLKDYLKK